MLGLNIIQLFIWVDTGEHTFSTKLKFEKGLNIIRAENSSGKSTCVNAIAYGLGLEAILGPSRKRPFPKSVYESLVASKEDDAPYFVQRSAVELIVENSRGEKVTVRRDIQGYSDKVSVKTADSQKDYFLGASGEIGSAKSENGFHYWLAKFIGWNLPTVAKFDGKESPLYLECIFPLFFIEQKRGWSEIQANVPTHYGIKNIKKSAIEFCLSIDSFDHEKKVASLKSQIEDAEREWEAIGKAAENIADFNSVLVNKLPGLGSERLGNIIEFRYLESNIQLSVYEKEKSLIRFLKNVSQEISQRQPQDERLNQALATIRELRRESEDFSNSIELAMLSIAESANKISTLKLDYDQYQQLRRLRKVGADIGVDVNTSKCPICDTEMDDTLANRVSKRAPMTIDENIEFLKNQLDFYKSIESKSRGDLEALRAKSKVVASRIDVEQIRLQRLREDLDDANGVTSQFIREKIQAEIAVREVQKIKSAQEELNGRASKIESTWRIATDALRLLRKNSDFDNRWPIIKELEAILKTNLVAFGFSGAIINDVSISSQTLRPEQEGYDIVAETSASDYIRIIWAYTLGLLMLAGNEETVRHGGFVVFDEPRQHEASKVSFISLINKAAESASFGGQVIFATSLDEIDLKAACENRNINLLCFKDYILQLDELSEIS
jgi:hypothetical protein